MKKRYLDTNVFIYPILYEDRKSKACGEILFKLIKNQFSGFTSFLTWDEFIYTLKKKKGSKIAIKEGEKFLRMPNLVFFKVDENTIFLAQKIMEKYNINPRDAIHAASALTHNIKKIISDDPDFDKIKEIKRIKIEKFT